MSVYITLTVFEVYQAQEEDEDQTPYRSELAHFELGNSSRLRSYLPGFSQKEPWGGADVPIETVLDLLTVVDTKYYFAISAFCRLLSDDLVYHLSWG